MIALIPARGGSKGLPRKNIRSFCGKPLIAHTIEAAKRSSKITDVYVSTDCQEIQQVATRYGAICPFIRPPGLATDDALAVDVYLHAIEWLQSNRGIECESLVILLPTAPLRTSYDINRAIELFTEKSADSVISCTPLDHPMSWICDVDDQEKLSRPYEKQMANRQAEDERYIPNGAIFVIKKSLLLKRTYYSDKTFGYIMPRERSIDIDTALDFKFAEFIMRPENAER